MSSRPGDAGQWRYLAYAVCLAAAWLALLPTRPLFNPDEGRYAEIPREMLSGGDWLIPHLNGVAYVEKPPLQYWATALSLQLFGAGEFGARFYTALCALGTLAIVWGLAAQLWGRPAAWRAAGVLSSFVLFVMLGQLLTLDMSLTFYTTLALAFFLRAQHAAGQGATAGRHSMLIAWAATALGVLTKGPVAALLPAAVLVLYSGLTRDVAVWRRLDIRRGLPLFLLIAVPWHWAAARRLPQFAEFYFIHEHVARYLTPSADRQEAWWFFVAVLALGCVPWTFSVARVVAGGWRRTGPGNAFDARRFLWIWLIFVCVFFSLSDSKLIPYILPALPAVALLIAAGPESMLRRELWIAAWVTAAFAAAFACAGWFGPHWLPASDRRGYFVQLATPLLGVAALLALVAALVLVRRGRSRRSGGGDIDHPWLILNAGWCLAALLLLHAARFVAPVYSGVVLARALERLPDDATIYSVGIYDQTLPFYVRRTTRLVAYRGELDFGLKLAPELEISEADFVREWRERTSGYAIMEATKFDELAGRGVPLRVVARDAHRVLTVR